MYIKRFVALTAVVVFMGWNLNPLFSYAQAIEPTLELDLSSIEFFGEAQTLQTLSDFSDQEPTAQFTITETSSELVLAEPIRLEVTIEEHIPEIILELMFFEPVLDLEPTQELAFAETSVATQVEESVFAPAEPIFDEIVSADLPTETNLESANSELLIQTTAEGLILNAELAETTYAESIIVFQGNQGINIDELLPVPVFAAPTAELTVGEPISLVHLATALLTSTLQAEIVTNFQEQKGFVLTAGSLENLPNEKIKEGWVSWAFVPVSIDINDFIALRSYAFEHFFGFTNDPQNVLIDDNLFIPDEPVRVAVFGWKCVTEKCDSFEDIPEIQFISREVENYHSLSSGSRIILSNYQSQ